MAGPLDPRPRCAWAVHDADECAYHDSEWGVPERDEHRLFECLTLEGAQAGLSWRTILKKRDGYRRAFEGFDPEVVARFSEADIDRLVQDASIVRHRQKIAATVNNARAVLDLRERTGGLPAFLWDFVDGEPIQNRWRSGAEVPGQTDLSQKLSRALKKAGFRFVGGTTCYAFMQATGMVNDHLVSCFRYREVQP